MRLTCLLIFIKIPTNDKNRKHISLIFKKKSNKLFIKKHLLLPALIIGFCISSLSAQNYAEFHIRYGAPSG
ncbi:MAG: hypothetical protein ACKOQ6_03000, partial [Bacteroidota bacterium]